MATSISRLAAVCALAAACASPAASPAPVTARPYSAYAAHGTLGLVELSQLQPDLDIYRAIEQVRPQFLRVRPGSSYLRGERPVIRVYINDNYAGDLSALRTLYVRDVVAVRRLQRTEMHLAPAGSLGPEEGAILVTLR
jgi:hypothetical protein